MARPQILSIPERLQAHPKYAGRGVCIGFVDSGFYPHPDLMRPKRRIIWLAGQVPRAEDSTSTATGRVASRMSIASRSPTRLPTNWIATTPAIPTT